ncbi:aminotransferase class I/II-fold pyridoxal phosphate-dependent enzyme [Hymenobacter sp. HMF4947]|uniref:Aminotransferase class I/II-fold pyridoxal phosphate-dependent enzyme n=1 Tax=Hymenobacter ginkgonis TaxID=2682976 RepID=A0A7K1THA0_9BACT|nr:aminotransferase class I/II-fold pyridoxal phosphate-dependent enzyme [Hymenobacter ginkgonis]MVN77795.1 aminotransferase class I/II-fold pyridoxal phosphate-dependent enzyme [Hymenobacter ginkgonis]
MTGALPPPHPITPVLDFTSALYLGPRVLPPPAGLVLTTGRPAALGEDNRARQVAHAVARRQGLEAGLLAPSTLHLFWDVFQLVPARGVVLLENGLYPVGRWGGLRAQAQGLPVVQFETDNLLNLSRLLHAYAQQGRPPWLVADGWHPGRGPAPLKQYADLLAPYPGAVLLLDDTQAFGVLGAGPSASRPLGRGGGGSLPRACLGLGRAAPEVLTITSLAKGLGVPVAVLAGRARRVAQFRRCSETRVHTSPVSAWHAWAAAAALRHDACYGEAARRRLGQRVAQFRRGLTEAGLRPHGGWFPVQKLVLARTTAALALHQQLRQAGIATVLLAGEHQPGVPEIAFCLRADHSAADIGRATATLAALARRTDWFTSSPFPTPRHELDLERFTQ